MNLKLTLQLENFVRDRAQSDDYSNASEVVREALHQFKRSEEERAGKMACLREAIEQGEQAINRRDSRVFNSEADLDAFFSEI